MVIKTTKTVDGVTYDYTYSDSGMMIERDGVRYSEAIDPAELGRTYTETDELIPTESVSGDEFMTMLEGVL